MGTRAEAGNGQPRRARPVTAADCADCAVRASDIFRIEAGDCLHEDMLPMLRHVDLAPRELLYVGGDAGQHVYVVRTGLIKLTRPLPNGSDRIVRLARPGDALGLEALLGMPYHDTAVAVSRVETCRVPVEAVACRFSQVSEMCRALFREWQKSLDAAESVAAELATGPAEARIARLLLHLGEERLRGRCPGLSREEMGALIGVTTETVSRIMARFKREGLVGDSPGGTCDLDHERLRNLAAG